MSTWPLEMPEDLRHGVRKFLRVVKDDGFVMYTLSNTFEGSLRRAHARLASDSCTNIVNATTATPVSTFNHR